MSITHPFIDTTAGVSIRPTPPPFSACKETMNTRKLKPFRLVVLRSTNTKLPPRSVVYALKTWFFTVVITLHARTRYFCLIYDKNVKKITKTTYVDYTKVCVFVQNRRFKLCIFIIAIALLYLFHVDDYFHVNMHFICINQMIIIDFEYVCAFVYVCTCVCV